MSKRELAALDDEQLQTEYWAWHDATVRSRIKTWIHYADDKRNAVTIELRRRGLKAEPRERKMA